ncbi:MAG: hypothetical protein J6R18_05305 [Kiritimatiellae bacterium]|nr:hypothetical protein [Kiritimatiellia bacterium]
MFTGKVMMLAVVLSAGNVMAELPPQETVKQRLSARLVLDNPEATADVIKAYFKHVDPAVRRFALFKLHEKDVSMGREAAKMLSSDPDDNVKALAKELLRNRNAARSVSMELPLSQSPANDHEIFRLKSIETEGENFVMPAKIDCDAVEVWFGKVTEHLMVWVNDVLVADFDPVREGSRELRCDVTKVVKWGASNSMWVTNEHGKDRWKKFSVEVLKCGK